MTTRAAGTLPQPVEQEVGEQKRCEVVEGEGALQTVGGDVPGVPEPADVVDQHVDPREALQDLGGHRRTCDWSDMSATKTSTGPLPAARGRRAAASVRPRSRPVIATCAPVATSPRAVASPIPPVAPVTSTVRPVMGPVICAIAGSLRVGDSPLLVPHHPRCRPPARTPGVRPERRWHTVESDIASRIEADLALRSKDTLALPTARQQRRRRLDVRPRNDDLRGRGRRTHLAPDPRRLCRGRGQPGGHGRRVCERRVGGDHRPVDRPAADRERAGRPGDQGPVLPGGSSTRSARHACTCAAPSMRPCAASGSSTSTCTSCTPGTPSRPWRRRCGSSTTV